MPDWCQNKLIVTGNEYAISKFHQDIQSQSKQIYKTFPNSEHSRRTGSCTYWNKEKGYGFIMDDNDNNGLDFRYERRRGDIFVHCSEIHANGAKILGDDESVEFDLVTQKDGRKKAVNVTGPNGRYVRGKYGYQDMKDFHDVNIECYGLKFQKYDDSANANDNDKTSEKQPNIIPQIIYSNGKNITYTFSTKFIPPLKWLRCTARRFSTFDISFKLLYQTENEVSYGCVVYENGKLIKDYSIEQFHLLDENIGEFEMLIRRELQVIFDDAVKENLKQYHICDNIQNAILNFCPQYLPQTRISNDGMYLKLMNELHKYGEHNDYHTPRDCIFYNVFNNIENKINNIFVEHGIEILDKFTLSYYIWGGDFSSVKQVFDKIKKTEAVVCCD
eukprot:218580_1